MGKGNRIFHLLFVDALQKMVSPKFLQIAAEGDKDNFASCLYCTGQ